MLSFNGLLTTVTTATSSVLVCAESDGLDPDEIERMANFTSQLLGLCRLSFVKGIFNDIDRNSMDVGCCEVERKLDSNSVEVCLLNTYHNEVTAL